MSKALKKSSEELDRIMAEMRNHGGEFVAMNSQRVAITYGETEEELELELAGMGLLLSDVIVSKVPEWDCGFIF